MAPSTSACTAEGGPRETRRESHRLRIEPCPQSCQCRCPQSCPRRRAPPRAGFARRVIEKRGPGPRGPGRSFSRGWSARTRRRKSEGGVLVHVDQAAEIGEGPPGPRGPERDSTSPRRCWSTWTKSRARLSGRHPTLRTLSSRSQSPISNLTPTWLRGCRGLKRAGHVPRPSTDPVRSSIGRRPRDAGAKGQCPRHRPSSPCSVPSPRRNRWTRFGSARCRRSCRGRFRVR
jgi:hypothetical protein